MNIKIETSIKLSSSVCVIVFKPSFEKRVVDSHRFKWVAIS